MNSTDLIADLEYLRETAPLSSYGAFAKGVARKAITALSPVMPPEVDAAIKFYRDPEQGANRITADLLEKLHRENEALKLQAHYYAGKCDELQQRNKELKAENKYLQVPGNGVAERILETRVKKLESQRDQLAEAIETLGTKGFLSFEDRAAFARAEHKRIMGEE